MALSEKKKKKEKKEKKNPTPIPLQKAISVTIKNRKPSDLKGFFFLIHMFNQDGGAGLEKRVWKQGHLYIMEIVKDLRGQTLSSLTCDFHICPGH